MNPVNKLTPEALDQIRKYAQDISPDGPLIIQLCDEIDALDEELDDAEDEVDRLRRKVAPRAVSGSVSRTAGGRWRVRWRDTDGKQRSDTFVRRHDAHMFLGEAKRRGYLEGAR